MSLLPFHSVVLKLETSTNLYVFFISVSKLNDLTRSSAATVLEIILSPVSDVVGVTRSTQPDNNVPVNNTIVLIILILLFIALFSPVFKIYHSHNDL